MNKYQNAWNSVKSNKGTIIKGTAVLLGASAGLAIGLDLLGRAAGSGVVALADDIEENQDSDTVVDDTTETD